jgi:hypothetical protein
MLRSALRWLFPKQEFVLELQVTQTQSVAYLRDRVRPPSLTTSSLLNGFDGIVGRVDGQQIILQRRRSGRQNGHAQEFRGRFVTHEARRYIVGEFAQPRNYRIETLVFVSLLAVFAIILLVLGARRGDVKGAGIAIFVLAFMLAAVLSRTRIGGWSTLDDIPVIERLLREAAGERVV